MTDNRQLTTHKGFTLLEIIIAIGLVSAAGIMVSISFSKINANKALETSASEAASVITQARTKTLAGENASQYGVYLGEGELILFRGASYSSSDPNNVSTSLHSLVGIRNVSLSGGGRSVVFQKLTGSTVQSGTFEVYLKQNPEKFRTISISNTGIVEEN